MHSWLYPLLAFLVLVIPSFVHQAINVEAILHRYVGAQENIEWRWKIAACILVLGVKQLV